MTGRGHAAFAGITDVRSVNGSNGDAERSVESVIVPSISAKWMKNRNKCDTTEIFCSAHQR